MDRIRGEIGSRRVEMVVSAGMRSVGFVFSTCHVIFVLLDVGSSVREMM